MLNQLIKELNSLENEEQKEILQGFFKTGKGEYGEGDVFLGIKVPVQRKIAEKYKYLSIPKIQQLVKSKIHEHRLTALLILKHKYRKASEEEKANIFNFYLKNTKYINNWDLVDISAPKIVGDFLFNKDKNVLYDLAHSKSIWEKRIAIISTWNFIKKEEFEDTLAIAEILLKDKNDLIQKAVGWMLREVGKKDRNTLEKFLKFYYKKMPRIMLRYSIEKFSEDKRKEYLKGLI